MSIGQAKFFIASALVLLISGFAVAVEGHPSGWLLVAIGGVNTLLGVLNVRKTQRRLNGVRRFRDRA
jgi:hypothetical protein